MVDNKRGKAGNNTLESRQKASGNTLGTKRFIRYVAAYNRLMQCKDNGYYLESIALLDSLISDRLASRLGFLSGEHVSVKDTLGKLCSAFLDIKPNQAAPLESNEAFVCVITEIRLWTKQRNSAIHAVAKVIRDDSDASSFDELLGSHRINVEKGIELLRRFDRLDTAAREKHGKIPATYPNAFFPENREPDRRD